MRILVIGAAGMLGGTLVERLVRDGRLGSERISQLTLVDRLAAEPSGDPGVVERAVADLAEPGMAGAIVTGRPDAIFHLAAVVSGEAEDDLEKGYRVNLDATRTLLAPFAAAIRATGRAWCTARRSPCSGHRFRTSSTMTTAPRLPPSTARRRR